MNSIDEAQTRRDGVAKIRQTRNGQRLAEQRASFAAIAQSVEKAGFWKAAREIRKEGDAAVDRMAETLTELEAAHAEIVHLHEHIAKQLTGTP